jgi:hypothetical protein
MAQIVVTLHTSTQLTSFLQFLSATDIRFSVTEENIPPFTRLLHEAQGVGLVSSDTASSISGSWVNAGIRLAPAEQNKPSTKPPEYLQPTPHFKSFCTHQYLNSAGRISKEGAMYFVECQITAQGVKRQGDIVYTNDYLRRLFATDALTLSKKDIAAAVDSFFAL